MASHSAMILSESKIGAVMAAGDPLDLALQAAAVGVLIGFLIYKRYERFIDAVVETAVVNPIATTISVTTAVA